ncbi:MAG: hypothetical protein ACJAUD_000298 [Crocinitomicaceae bacterium]|jgi:hypothetical protein
MGHPKTRTFKRLRKQITSNGRSAFFSERTSSVLIIIGIGIIVIGIVIFKWNESLNPKSTIASDKIGQLGDFIGGIVGSLWALAGVILFYVALSLQRKEFKLQRLELKATRSVFQQQSEQLKIQQRENTFFHLLDNHKKTVTTVSDKERVGTGKEGRYETTSGYNVIQEKWKEVERDLTKFKNHLNKNSIVSLQQNEYYNPFKSLNSFEDFNSIYSSIYYMVEFVVEELNNSKFHLTTIYMNLSVSERLAFGAFCYYEIIKSDATLNLEEVNFDFTRDFLSCTSFLEKERIPPIINYGLGPSINTTKRIKISEHFSKIVLSCKTKSVVIKQLYLENELGKDDIIKEPQSFSMQEPITIDLFPFINTNYYDGHLEKITIKSTEVEHSFKLVLVLEEEGELFNLEQNLTYYKSNKLGLGLVLGVK